MIEYKVLEVNSAELLELSLNRYAKEGYKLNQISTIAFHSIFYSENKIVAVLEKEISEAPQAQTKCIEPECNNDRRLVGGLLVGLYCESHRVK